MRRRGAYQAAHPEHVCQGRGAATADDIPIAWWIAVVDAIAECAGPASTVER